MLLLWNTTSGWVTSTAYVSHTIRISYQNNCDERTIERTIPNNSETSPTDQLQTTTALSEHNLYKRPTPRPTPSNYQREGKGVGILTAKLPRWNYQGCRAKPDYHFQIQIQFQTDENGRIYATFETHVRHPYFESPHTVNCGGVGASQHEAYSLLYHNLVEPNRRRSDNTLGYECGRRSTSSFKDRDRPWRLAFPGLAKTHHCIYCTVPVSLRGTVDRTLSLSFTVWKVVIVFKRLTVLIYYH